MLKSRLVHWTTALKLQKQFFPFPSLFWQHFYFSYFSDRSVSLLTKWQHQHSHFQEDNKSPPPWRHTQARRVWWIGEPLNCEKHTLNGDNAAKRHPTTVNAAIIVRNNLEGKWWLTNMLLWVTRRGGKCHIGEKKKTDLQQWAHKRKWLNLSSTCLAEQQRWMEVNWHQRATEGTGYCHLRSEILGGGGGQSTASGAWHENVRGGGVRGRRRRRNST